MTQEQRGGQRWGLSGTVLGPELLEDQEPGSGPLQPLTVGPWVGHLPSLSPGFCICEGGLNGCLQGLLGYVLWPRESQGRTVICPTDQRLTSPAWVSRRNAEGRPGGSEGGFREVLLVRWVIRRRTQKTDRPGLTF